MVLNLFVVAVWMMVTTNWICSRNFLFLCSWIFIGIVCIRILLLFSEIHKLLLYFNKAILWVWWYCSTLCYNNISTLTSEGCINLVDWWKSSFLVWLAWALPSCSLILDMVRYHHIKLLCSYTFTGWIYCHSHFTRISQLVKRLLNLEIQLCEKHQTRKSVHLDEFTTY